MASAGLSILHQTRRVFADTAFFFELLDPGAQHHERAVEIAAEVARLQLQVVTTWEIVLECATLLRYRLHFEASEVFLNDVVPELVLLYPDDEERTIAVQLFLRRAKARRLSLCDALSYVMVTKRLDNVPCLTFDDDFAALGLLVVR